MILHAFRALWQEYELLERWARLPRYANPLAADLPTYLASIPVLLQELEEVGEDWETRTQIVRLRALGHVG
jgi:hypothetical protein